MGQIIAASLLFAPILYRLSMLERCRFSVACWLEHFESKWDQQLLSIICHRIRFLFIIIFQFFVVVLDLWPSFPGMSFYRYDSWRCWSMIWKVSNRAKKDSYWFGAGGHVRWRLAVSMDLLFARCCSWTARLAVVSRDGVICPTSLPIQKKTRL